MFRVEARGNLTEEQKERRLEYLLQEPGIKIGDVILSVGTDEEMMEIVRKLSEEENNNQPARELEELGTTDHSQSQSQSSMKDEIKSYEEELSEILADMRMMRDQQSVGCPEDRREILLNMMADLETSVREDHSKLELLHNEVEQALLTEKNLKEEIDKYKRTEAEARGK